MRLRSGPIGKLSLALLLLLNGTSCSRFGKQYKCELAGQPEPKTPYEYVQRGVEHARRDELSCALAACSEAVRLAPKQSAGYGCRGSVLLQQQHPNEALKEFDRALELDPENGDYYFQKGKAHSRLNDDRAAIQDYDKAIELISSEVGRSMVHAARADLNQKLDQLVQAIGDYSEAIKLAPNYAYHYDHRGNLYYAKGEFQKALEDFTSAIERDPANKFFYLDRARVYRQLQQSELAEKDEATAATIK